MVQISSGGFGADNLAVGAFRDGGAGSFSIKFERVSKQGFEDVLKRDAIAVRGASVLAVRETTVEVKLAIRAYIDAHFSGSSFTSNSHRRVANASAQDKFYDEIEGKGQYAGLVYSKFGKRDAGGFVDYLLLHVRGGTINGNSWLRLINDKNGGGASSVAQSGFFKGSNSDIFFVESKDGRKLFQLRRFRNERNPATGKLGRTRLIATLLKDVVVPARLTGIDEIARSRPELFDRNFRAAMSAYGLGDG